MFRRKRSQVKTVLPTQNDNVSPSSPYNNRRKSKRKFIRGMRAPLLLLIAVFSLSLYYCYCYHYSTKQNPMNIDIIKNPEFAPTKEVIDDRNPHDVPFVHIINTRFMQHQGNLTTLATARLHLFESICLPSMIRQSSQNFMWFIKIDPELDPTILQQLIDAIKSSSSQRERQNIFLIASNRNFLIGHDPGAWRGGEEAEEVISHVRSTRDDKGNGANAINGIYTGDVQLLYDAEVAAVDAQANSQLGKFVLETRLDADDGLHSRYLQHVQEDAMEKFLSTNMELVGRGYVRADAKNADDEDDGEEGGAWQESSIRWYYWCASTHVKWYVDAEGDHGQLDGEKTDRFCITPGLTVGFNIGTEYEDVPTHFGHHELYRHLGENKNNGGDDNTCGAAKCLDFVDGFVSAVRSRTPTSAGMKDVQYHYRDNQKSREGMWQLLSEQFGVKIERAIESKRYFMVNMKAIARENLEGQCRGEHSCKKSSKQKLAQIISSDKE